MTIEEFKAKLASQGYVGEPTAELLKNAGWVPSDPLAGVTPSGPVLSPSQLRDELALLVQESKEGGSAAQIVEGIVRFGTKVFQILG